MNTGTKIDSSDIPIADPDDLPANESVKLITGITGVTHSPKIIDGKTSGSGKTVGVSPDDRRSYRLDSDEIFAGETEFRDSTYFELYTPARFRSRQRANHAPGPQSGANEVIDAVNLDDPTHWPANGGSEETPKTCPNCEAEGIPWRTNHMKNPVCEACGHMLTDEKEEENVEDNTPDKWNLSRLESGDVLILDGYREEFIVIKKKTPRGSETVNELVTVCRVDRQWKTYIMRKLHSTQGRRLEVLGPDDERSAVVNVDARSHARDFEVVRNDTEAVRRYLEDTRDQHL